MNEDLESDNEEEPCHDGSTRVCFSKEEKICMRSPWQRALIIKTFGRRMGFSFLVEKIRSMWKPTRGMDCIDLGFDYYLVKFELVNDVDHILKGGPWFIGQHFLAIRQWEPEFKASSATLSSVAVWIRLSELPIEFYEANALLKIGRAIGLVLRIDSHTVNGERGRFARMIGHKAEACPYIIRETPNEAGKEQDTCTQEKGNDQEVGLKDKELDKTKDYGEWMVVNRRKPNGRMRAKQHALEQSLTCEASSEHNVTARPRVADQSTREGKRKAAHTQSAASISEVSKPLTSNLSKPNRGKGTKVMHSRANTNQKVINLVRNQPFGVSLNSITGPEPSGLGKDFMKVDGSHQGPFVFSSPSGEDINQQGNLFEADATSPYVGNNGREGKMGDLLQREDNSCGGRNHSVDKARSNRDLGMVRDGAYGGLEEHFSVDGDKPKVGLPTVEGRSLGHNPKPLVEVLNRPTTSTSAVDAKLKEVSNRIKRADFGKIMVRSRGGFDTASVDCEKDPGEQTGGVPVDGQPASDKNAANCGASNQGNNPYQGITGHFGDHQSLHNSTSGEFGVKDRLDECMEVEGH
nr:hypothetical protein CFP56_67667 [Quercus suber]